MGCRSFEHFSPSGSFVGGHPIRACALLWASWVSSIVARVFFQRVRWRGFCHRPWVGVGGTGVEDTSRDKRRGEL